MVQFTQQTMALVENRFLDASVANEQYATRSDLSNIEPPLEVYHMEYIYIYVGVCVYLFIHLFVYRRKFRSQTSDNMDR